MMKGNEFFIKKSNHAVILIHGFTSSTQEIRGIAEHLVEHNFTVIAPLLKGHNTTQEEFEKTSAKDYYESVLLAYEKVKNYKTIDVVGFSLGGTLATKLSIEKRIRKVILLAPAIKPDEVRFRAVQVLRKFIKRIDKSKRIIPGTKIKTPWDLNNPKAVKNRIAYDYFLLEQLYSASVFARELQKELKKLKQPVLIMHSKNDKVVPPQGSQFLYDNLGSKEKYLIWLNRSGHVITEDIDSEYVKKQILLFLN